MEINPLTFSNKDSLGKYFRSLKRLKKSEVSASPFSSLSPELSSYLEILKAKGLEIHPFLSLSSFQTRNDLKYTGIIATNYLTPNQILLKIPRHLLLTTKTAYFSELKPIFDENPEFYSRYIEKNWEDHILLTFLLHEFQKKEKSYWHFLIKLLPKDIDYLAFWSDNELDMLEDPQLKKKASELLSEFEQIFLKLSEILSKYPQIFEKETYNYENVKWIHIHLITRSFGGKYLNYVTMVPFAEFFNHECTNVYYDFLKIGESSETKNEGDSSGENEEEKFDAKWDENLSTSNESNKSGESDRNEDFADLKLGSELVEGQKDTILDKKLIEREEFAVYFREVIEWIFNTIDLGDNVSCFYFNQVLKKLTELKKKCLNNHNNKKNLREINEAFKNLQVMNLKYKYHLLQYNTNNKGFDVDAETILTQKKVFSELDKTKPDIEALKKKKYSGENLWADDEFEFMILKSSEKDFFEKNSQVYFCYGRLSNRKLLQRYGMTLEFNKYDNVVVKINLTDYVHISNIDFINSLNNFKLKKNRSFKLCATNFNLDLLLFARGLNWDFDKNTIEEFFQPKNLDFELKSLAFMRIIIEKELKRGIKTSFEMNSDLVKDKTLNYHEHFAVIYRLERQRILQRHRKGIDLAVEFVERLKQGMNIGDFKLRIVGMETDEEVERNRWFLKSYLEKFVSK